MPVPDFSPGEVLTAAAMDSLGLWRVTTCTVTSVGGTAATASNGVITIGNGNTSVTVSSAFSADYQNYLILMTNYASATGGQSVKMSLSGSTGSTYFIGGIYGTFGTAASTAYGPAATTSWTDMLPLDSTTASGRIQVYCPNQAVATIVESNGVRVGAASGWYHFNGMDTNASAATGFVLSPSVGGASFTKGTIRVYGYRN